MKEKLFENLFTKEVFECKDLKNIQVIEGIEYITVQKMDGTKRNLLMRKDALKRVTKK
jgi:hypothetical protein